MTKLEIVDRERLSDGTILLYPEGMFYKAYEQSAFILCTKVHPFKVSVRDLKGLDGPLVSVGFPQSSLARWTAEASVEQEGQIQHREEFLVQAVECSHCEYRRSGYSKLLWVHHIQRYFRHPVGLQRCHRYHQHRHHEGTDVQGSLHGENRNITWREDEQEVSP